MSESSKKLNMHNSSKEYHKSPASIAHCGVGIIGGMVVLRTLHARYY